MANYKHGVYTSEVDTSLVAPVEGTAGLQVIVGTAPVHTLADPAAAVNKPLLVSNYKEAVAAVGYSDDFAKYTICEAIAANFSYIGVGPLVLINVLDPAKHSAAFSNQVLQVNGGVAVLNKAGVLLPELKVEVEIEAETAEAGAGSGTATGDGAELDGDSAETPAESETAGESEKKTLTPGTDYTASRNDDDTVSIILIAGSEYADATQLIVSGKAVDAGLVTAADIVGGVNTETGEETGLEVIRQVYPKLGMTPGILLAPRFSMDATVAAALQAKTKGINGVFKCVCFIDIDSRATTGARKYADVKNAKETQAATDTNGYGVWPACAIGDIVFSGSVMAGALTAYTDAMNDDTPNVSPSNKTLPISKACLIDGTEVVLDQEQANTVNSFGVATFLNVNGFRLWGNNTLAYPGNTDPKDRWISVKRFLCWAANTFILTYFQKVDDPMNKRLIEAIVDSENVRGNGFVARGVCARYETTYNEDENTTTDLLDGRITFHQYITPFTPAEDIEDVIEFDPNALSAALSQ